MTVERLTDAGLAAQLEMVLRQCERAQGPNDAVSLGPPLAQDVAAEVRKLQARIVELEQRAARYDADRRALIGINDGAFV